MDIMYFIFQLILHLQLYENSLLLIFDLLGPYGLTILKIIALLQVRFLTRSPGIPYQIKFLAA